MTTFKSDCPLCGKVTLRRDAVRIYGGIYTFICPECRFRVEWPATARALELLASGGVLPDPPLTEKDLRELMTKIGLEEE